MKKLALLLSLALLAACGGGGTSGSNANTPAYQAGGPTGSLTVTMPKESSKGIQPVNTSTETKRRAIVTNPAIKNSAGQVVQFTIPDFAPTDKFTIPNIPVGKGYTVEVIDYTRTTTVFGSYTAVYQTFDRYSSGVPIYRDNDQIIPASSRVAKPMMVTKYGSATFEMTNAGATVDLSSFGPPAAVTLTVAPTYAGKIPSRDNLATYHNLSTMYKITANPTAVCNTKWQLRQAYAYVNISSATFAGTATQVNGTTTPTLIGPAAYNENNVLQTKYRSIGDFYLKDSLILPNERYSDFLISSGRNVLASDLYTRMQQQANVGP
jgi:hypothetical protein